MARGRRPAGPELVAQLRGSEPAKQRLRVILETLAGRRGLAEACVLLEIGGRQFHSLRLRLLQAALDSLEPRPAGRPPVRQTMESDPNGVAILEAENRRLRLELQAAQIREEIALAVPHLFRPKPARKKRRQQTRRRGRHSTGGRLGT